MFLSKYIPIRPQSVSQRIRQKREVQKLSSDREKLGYMIAAEPDYKQSMHGSYPMLAGSVVGPPFADALEAYRFAVLHKVALIDRYMHMLNEQATEAK